MPDWNDVRQLALELPRQLKESPAVTLQWRVKDKLFVWERPLRSPDFEALGERAPERPGARVPWLGT